MQSSRLSAARRGAIMCAEAVWGEHRSIGADHMLSTDAEVLT